MFTETGVAAAAGMRPGAACVLCHEREHTEFALANGSVTAEQHAFTGFPLAAPHDRVDCTQCHSPALAEFGARHPGRSPERCADCHADVHGGQFAQSEIAANGCIDCHHRERWSPPAFGVEQHAYARLPLDGEHATTDCHRCHLRSDDDAPRQFVGTPHRCERCHDDAHRGAFDAFAAELAGDARGICANCHRTTAFADEAAAGFDHARFTAFGLHGAHAPVRPERKAQPGQAQSDRQCHQRLKRGRQQPIGRGQCDPRGEEASRPARQDAGPQRRDAKHQAAQQKQGIGQVP